jgi:hypothetical protein
VQTNAGQVALRYADEIFSLGERRTGSCGERRTGSCVNSRHK